MPTKRSSKPHDGFEPGYPPIGLDGAVNAPADADAAVDGQTGDQPDPGGVYNTKTGRPVTEDDGDPTDTGDDG